MPIFCLRRWPARDLIPPAPGGPPQITTTKFRKFASVRLQLAKNQSLRNTRARTSRRRRTALFHSNGKTACGPVEPSRGLQCPIGERAASVVISVIHLSTPEFLKGRRVPPKTKRWGTRSGTHGAHRFRAASRTWAGRRYVISLQLELTRRLALTRGTRVWV